MAATSRPGHSETRLLRELILEHLSRWLWRTRADLQHRVERDFGTIGDRRFCRQLKFLRNAGGIDMIIDETMDPPMPVYRALPGARAEIAGKIPHLFCKKCGLVNAKTIGHANGHRNFTVKHLPMQFVSFVRPTPQPNVVRNPVARLRNEGRWPSAQIPGSPPPAGSADQPRHPRHPRRAARRAS